MQSAFAGVAHFINMRREIFNKCLVIICAAGLAADAVYFQHIRDSEPAEKGSSESDYLCVGCCFS